MAFFGPTMQMEGMSHDATFVVPLPKSLSALQNVAPSKDVQLKMRVVPAHGPRKNVPALKGISVNIV
jgi:tyrosinase